MAPFPSLEIPYVELPRALTWAEAELIEKKCNEAIQKATRIWVDVTKQEDGFVKTTTQGVRENRGIPEDYQDVRWYLPALVFSLVLSFDRLHHSLCLR